MGRGRVNDARGSVARGMAGAVVVVSGALGVAGCSSTPLPAGPAAPSSGSAGPTSPAGEASGGATGDGSSSTGGTGSGSAGNAGTGTGGATAGSGDSSSTGAGGSDGAAGAQPSPGAAFVLPGDCAAVAGPTILTQWAPTYGEATLLTQNAGSENPLPSIQCIYGSDDTHTILTIVVSALAPAGSPAAAAGQTTRAEAEAELDGDGYPKQSVGRHDLYVETVSDEPTGSGADVVSDAAWIIVGTQNTTQSGEDVSPQVQAWANDVATRLNAN